MLTLSISSFNSFCSSSEARSFERGILLLPEYLREKSILCQHVMTFSMTMSVKWKKKGLVDEFVEIQRFGVFKLKASKHCPFHNLHRLLESELVGCKREVNRGCWSMSDHFRNGFGPFRLGFRRGRRRGIVWGVCG